MAAARESRNPQNCRSQESQQAPRKGLPKRSPRDPRRSQDMPGTGCQRARSSQKNLETLKFSLPGEPGSSRKSPRSRKRLRRSKESPGSPRNEALRVARSSRTQERSSLRGRSSQKSTEASKRDQRARVTLLKRRHVQGPRVPQDLPKTVEQTKTGIALIFFDF